MSSVFNIKLRPCFLEPFTVTAKKGLAYALHLPRKLRTNPVIYVCFLQPKQDPPQENVGVLAPIDSVVPRYKTFEAKAQLTLNSILSTLQLTESGHHQFKGNLPLSLTEDFESQLGKSFH